MPAGQVRVTDDFWAPRLRSNHKVTIPHVLRMNEETGRIDNFRIAAGEKEGRYSGHHTSADSDVFKAIDGAARSLDLFPDPALERQVDELAATIAAAQEPDGYLFTPRKIGPADRANQVGPERWSYLIDSHELYNMGHLYEAAVSYYRATKKTNLLDIATRNADFLCETFGPDKLRTISGHQEIEIGLVKLYEVTGRREYLNLAKFFLDERGNHSNGRQLFTYTDDPAQEQDHLPVIEQFEARGHAVRAGYQYAAMVDVASRTEAPGYMKAIGRLWEDIIHRKLYLTGGIGARLYGEAFDEAYQLPNEAAKAETCAAIANMLWQQRLFLESGNSKYVDILERVLYNGFLASPSLEGDRFFYNNPLASAGEPGLQKTVERQPWYGVPCCPTNVARTLPFIPGNIYAQRGNELYVNLYIGSEASIPLSNGQIDVRLETQYPWDGRVKLGIEMDHPMEFTLRLRLPGWAIGRPVPGDLYRYVDSGLTHCSASLNGESFTPALDVGYIAIRREWSNGDTVDLNLPMPVRRVVSHSDVEEDRGLVAIERGPLVYCIEGVDHGGSVEGIRLSDSAALATEHRDNLLREVTVIRGRGLTAIPYYAWANRGLSPMAVWLPRSK